MIQPINNCQHRHYINHKVSFKNSDKTTVEENSLSQKRDRAIIDFVDVTNEQKKKQEVLTYVALGYCAFTIPLLFWFNRKDKNRTKTISEALKQNFVSLKDEKNIPTLDNCKTINKKLSKFLQQQVEYSKLTSEEIEKAGKPKSAQKFLLSGAPGVGKSFYAKIYAKTLDAEYAEIKYSDVNSRWSGECLENIQGTMEGIIEKANSFSSKKFVVVFNEIDAFIPSAEGLSSGIGRSLTKLEDRNCFLNYLDKIGEQCPNVTIIGTTNISPKSSGLDGAALSRFKKVMTVDFPEEDCLFEGLKMYLKDIPQSERFIEANNEKLHDLAKQMSNRKCSFRDLNEIIDTAKNSHLEEYTKNKDSKFKHEYLEKALKDLEFTDGEMQAGK